MDRPMRWRVRRTLAEVDAECAQPRLDASAGLANRRGKLVLAFLNVWEHPVAGGEQLLELLGLAAHMIMPLEVLAKTGAGIRIGLGDISLISVQRFRPENLRIGPRSNPTSEDQRFGGSVEEIGLRDPAPEREDDVDRAQPRRRGCAQDLEWRSDSFTPSTQEQNGPDVRHEYPHGLGEPEIHLRSRDSLEGSSAHERPDAGRQKVRAL
jgi:hypothetical protein